MPHRNTRGDHRISADLSIGLQSRRSQSLLLYRFVSPLWCTWQDTAVLLVTEFGRTAAVDGTRGTDHGTATAAFLLGGAVAGGRVVANWPGFVAGFLPSCNRLENVGGCFRRP